MPLNFQTAKLIAKQQLAENFYLLTCQPSQPLVFKPGQFIVLRVNPERVVQYSLASIPNQPTFDLLVQYVPHGEASEWVKNDLHVGDTIEYYGPLGICTFHPDDQAREILFMATGAGLAPHISIIDDLLINQSESRPISLYFGIHNQANIIYSDHFNQLMAQHPNFKYNISLSQASPGWTGHSGYITHAVSRDISSAKHLAAYLCGSEAMIADAKLLLTQKGIATNRIYTEKFW